MRLTAEERRRMYMNRQKARKDMFALQPISDTSQITEIGEAVRRRIIKTAALVLLLGGGLLAWHSFEFHLPHSLMEALLPRL